MAVETARQFVGAGSASGASGPGWREWRKWREWRGLSLVSKQQLATAAAAVQQQLAVAPPGPLSGTNKPRKYIKKVDQTKHHVTHPPVQVR